MPEPVGSIIGIIGLGADMDLDLRTDPFCNGENARIRNDQCIRSYGLQLLKIRFHTRKISIMSQDIGSHIDSDPMLMGKLDALLHIFHGKVFCLGTKAEGFAADIYGIGSKNHRSL